MRSTMSGRSLAALGMMVALAACAPAGTPAADGAGGAGGAGASLAGTRWRLEELNGSPAVAAAASAVPTLAFEAAGGNLGGNTGCNQFNGPYTQSGTALRIGPLTSTRRACVDPSGNEREAAFLRALEATTRYTVSGNALVLYASDRPIARLRRSGG